MIADPDRLPSTLYCDLFYSNPGAEEYRAEHLEVWVRIALREKGRQSLDELATTFLTAYPGCRLEKPQLREAMERLATAGDVEAGSENSSFRLTQSGLTTVQQAADRYSASRKAFTGAVLSHIAAASTLPLADPESKAVAHCLERLAIRCMLGERAALERLYKQPDDFRALVAKARSQQEALGECLQGQCPTAQATRVIELRRDIVGGLSRAIEEGRGYLHTLHRSVIAAFFLVQDPYHVKNIRDAVKLRTYFLDTNLYLAWFFESQTPHRTVKPLMELLQRYGVKLCVLRATVEEIKRIEVEARSAAKKAEHDVAFAAYLAREHKAIFADYWLKRQADKNLTFATYEKLWMGPERVLGAHGVEIVNIEFEPGEDFPKLEATFRNAIKGAKMEGGRIIREEAVDHDTAALLAVSKLQLRGERDAWGAKTRFLSLDSTLNGAIDEIRNVLHRRLEPVDSPHALARLLLPQGAVDLSRDAYEEYIVNCVQQHLGLASEMRGYGDVNLIEKLNRAGLPIRTILDVPGNLLEQALADLQGRKDLTRKIDQALAAHDPETREGIVREIGQDLSEALALRSDLLRETETQLEEERRERKEALTQVAVLNARLEGLAEEIAQVRVVQAASDVEISMLRRRNRRTLLAVGGLLLAAAVVIWLYLHV
jgi:hypothetical protein